MLDEFYKTVQESIELIYINTNLKSGIKYRLIIDFKHDGQQILYSLPIISEHHKDTPKIGWSKKQ